MPRKVTKYDYRLGEDFTFNDPRYGLVFSSLRSRFIVLDAEEMSWGNRAAEIVQTMQATSRSGFLTVVPWAPGARTVFHQVRGEFGRGLDGRDSIAVKLDPTLSDVQRAITLCEAGANGEWGIVGAIGPLRIGEPLCKSNRSVDIWNLTAILCQADVIGCYLYFGEHRSSIFMTREFVGLEQVMDKLLAPEDEFPTIADS